MKIVCVEPTPNYGGGSEQIVLDLASGFSKLGHVVSLVHSDDGTMLSEYKSFCERVVQLPLRAFGWRTLLSSLDCARRIRRLLKSLQADVVICSELHYVRMLALATAFSRVKLVFHLGLPASAPMWSKRLAYRFVHAGVCPSEHTRQTWLADGWPAKRLHVVPNWVDSERFRPAACKTELRKTLSLPIQAKLVCYVGRLVSEKGVATLLEAFRKLCEHRKDIHLVMVGAASDGTLGHWPQLSAELGIPDDHVHFMGRQTNSQDFFAASDLAVVPSEWDEPFGLTVIEAMACGIPPVVSSAGILSRLLGNQSERQVFPTGDSVALARCITQMLDISTSENAEMCIRIRARAVQHFAMSKSLEQYQRISTV